MNVEQYIKEANNIQILQRQMDTRKITIEASYYDKGMRKYVTMLSDGSIVNRQPKKDEKAYKFSFTKKAQVFNTTNPLDVDKLKVLLRHPGCFVPGQWDDNQNPNCVGMGQVYVVSAQRDAKYNALETKILLAVANRVNSMSYEEMVNTCYLTGFNPLNKTEDEIFQHLYDKSQHDPDSFTDLLDDVNMEKNIIIKKALSLGVIKKERNNLYWGTEIIGQDESDVLGYFVKNPEQYKGVRNQVAKKDHLPVSVNKVSKPKAKTTKKTAAKVE